MMKNSTRSSSNPAIPLCVDLDGTLLRTDMLIESVFGLLRQTPLNLFLLVFWLFGGKAHFKQQIAERVEVDMTLLPFNGPLLEFLHEQKAQGRHLILATASNIKYASQVADHLELFDRVMASDAETNLSGRTKCRQLVDAYGNKGFDYVANAGIDLKIWAHARRAILVDTSPGVRRKAGNMTEVERVFDDRNSGLALYLKAIRLHQWLKNLLILVPLGMAHQILQPQLLLQATLAFFAFGLCASSVYLLNDLLDLPADRQHRTKRYRPLAAGTLPIMHGLLMIPTLLILAFAITLCLPIEFLGVMLLYYGVTLAYSLYLKQSPLTDVLTLAGLYTLRIMAGAAAVSTAPSHWILAFSMFLFFSLALLKRYSELLGLVKEQPWGNAATRGYRTVDLEGLAQSGIASGYLSVLVLALYINSDQVRALYTHPEFIWLLCPLLLYWIGRVWFLARRNEMHEDPVIFATQDKRSLLIASIGILILWVAT
ncbi:MAG: UbiA family prenyltransferase [Gammaproteobacteria bacterium]|nr:UbiA family prenyltransferase [Gammaproteobacteria bacterium]